MRGLECLNDGSGDKARPHKLPDRKLINRVGTLGKVDWRIKMGAAMFCCRKL